MQGSYKITNYVILRCAALTIKNKVNMFSGVH